MRDEHAMVPKRPLSRRLQGPLFHLLLALLLAGVAYLSLRYDIAGDWSDLSRNSLHPASIELLQRLQAPLRFTSFAPEDPQLRGKIRELVARYQRFSPKIELKFINPSLEPALTRELDIRLAGELLLEYQGRREKLVDLTEQKIGNAIQRLLNSGDQWIASLTGHGERSLTGRANFDLGQFGKELTLKGFRLQELSLAESLQVPDNSALLLIASPQTELLPGERLGIRQYLDQGGNLLWLSDPDSTRPTELLDFLGLQFLPGTLVDASGAELGLDSPTFALIHRYPKHPVTDGMRLLTLFPLASALETEPNSRWRPTPLLKTLQRAWNETGPLKGTLQRNPQQGEQPGPLVIGYALERTLESGTRQRVVVIGDGDFLSNAYLGNGGNLDLGFNLVRWLANEENLLQIPPITANDLQLELSRAEGALIGLGFLVILPVGLLLVGVVIWWRRERPGTQ